MKLNKYLKIALALLLQLGLVTHVCASGTPDGTSTDEDQDCDLSELNWDGFD